MPDAKSWRKRRWDLFLKEYYGSSEFSKKADMYMQLEDKKDGETGLLNLMVKHKIPIQTLDAAMAFIKNPLMPDKEIYKLIHPPISYWNIQSLAETDDPTNWGTKLGGITRMLKPIRQKYDIPDDDAIEFSLSVVKALVDESTVIQVAPYTGKSELKELVSEFSDEIQQLTTNQEESWYYPKRLLEKNYTSADVTTLIVNSMILRLKDEGWTYKAIQEEIKTLAVEPPDLDVMKQLVYNARKRRGK